MPSATQVMTQVNNEFNSAIGKKNKGGDMDKESFMLLLVTQFKYQDPLNPMEDKEFIAQLAQFSSLEQMINLNTSMDSLTDATKDQQMTNATSYIGKNVTVSGNMIGKVTDPTTQQISVSKFRYAPAGNVAPGSKLVVRDMQNNPVYVLTMNEGRMAGQTYEFQWDGRRSDGSIAPDGVYTIGLAMFNSKGEAVLSDQVVDARVTGVVNNNGEVCLGLDGGQLMKLTDVRQVTDPSYVGTKPQPGTPDSGKDPVNPEQKPGGQEGGGDPVKPENGGTPEGSGGETKPEGPVDPTGPDGGSNGTEKVPGAGGEAIRPDPGSLTPPIPPLPGNMNRDNPLMPNLLRRAA